MIHASYRYAAKLHVTLSLEVMLFVVIPIFYRLGILALQPNDVTLLRIHKDFIHPEERKMMIYRSSNDNKVIIKGFIMIHKEDFI